MSKPLIVRLPNWIGDVMMTLPALHALIDAGFELEAYGRGWAPDLLSGMPMKTLSIPKEIRAGAAVLKQSPIKHAVIMPSSFSTAAAMRLAGKQAVGYRAEARSFLLKKTIPYHRDIHYVKRFWRPAELANQVWGDPAKWPAELPPRLVLPVNPLAKTHAEQVLKDQGVTGPYWMLSSGATGLINGRPKVWPHWRELCEALIAQGHQTVACTVAREEADCRAALPGATILVDLPLSTFSAILSGAEQVVANDSGAMHVATAVGAPTLGIFGLTNPRNSGPWGQHYIGDLGQWPSCEQVLQRLQELNNA